MGEKHNGFVAEDTASDYRFYVRQCVQGCVLREIIKKLHLPSGESAKQDCGSC